MGLTSRIRDLIRQNPGEVHHDEQFLQSCREDLLALDRKVKYLNGLGSMKEQIGLGDSCERWLRFLTVEQPAANAASFN